MKALLLTDSEYKNGTYPELYNLVIRILSKNGFETDKEELSSTLNSCMGCFGCWVKKPGECVIQDKMADLNQQYTNSDAVIFLSPVVYGQFSANMKNAMDRTLPCLLPFFYRRKDGSTMHPLRYKKNPELLIIGYGTKLTDEETQLFKDITLKHRYDASLEIWQNDSDTEKIQKLITGIGKGNSTAADKRRETV